MSIPHPTLRTLGAALALSAAVAPSAAAELLAGAARRDLTPENGRNFFGYVRPDIFSEGVALRLWARALVLADGDSQLALVTLDLGEPIAKNDLVARIEDLGYGHDNVVLMATHTHAGPDTAFGVDAFFVEQIAQAIREAHESRVPAVAGWADVPLEDASDNRSIEAHLANHGFDLEKGEGSVDDDPLGRLHTLNPTLRMLRVDTAGGSPLAAWAQFSAHPTTFIPSNKKYSADYSGAALLHFEAGFEGAAPFPILSNGTEGDQSPRHRGYNSSSSADALGRVVAEAMREAWDAAGAALSAQVPLDTRWTTACFCGQEIAPGETLPSQAFWGASFFGGAEDGRSIFWPLGTEGTRRPPEFADPVQGRKLVVAPAPWGRTPEVQAVRVGSRVILTVPGEPTAEMGARMRAAAEPHLPAGVDASLLVGLANVYSGYYSTPEEYDQQHYEGGHSVFGLYGSHHLRDLHAALTQALRDGTPAPPPASTPGPGSTDPGEPFTGDGGVVSHFANGPLGDVERMELAWVRWSGGQDGRDRPVGAPFVMLERRIGAVFTEVDSDLGLRTVWSEQGGHYTARVDLPPDETIGAYRFRVRSARYDLVTLPFRVVVSEALRVLGVTASPHVDGARLDFEAQNPPPDPEHGILFRERRPSGGTLRFALRGVEYEAAWDAGTGSWAAVVPAVDEGEEIALADGALVDGLGNRSGPARSLVVGEVDPLEWPPTLEPGGGVVAGPFGVGVFPPDPTNPPPPEEFVDALIGITPLPEPELPPALPLLLGLALAAALRRLAVGSSVRPAPLACSD